MRQILNFGLRLLAKGNFLLELFVGVDQLRRALGDESLKILVRVAQRGIRLPHLFLSAFAGDLGIHTGQRDDEIHRLGHVIVGAGRKGFRHVRALCLGGHHDHRKRHG